MRIIVNADDFGYNSDCNKATIELLEGNTIRSATILTDFQGFSEAVHYAKNATKKDLSFGLHFNLVEASGLMKYSTKDGFLKVFHHLHPVIQRFLLLTTLINKEIIAKEFERQLLCLLNAGVNVSHIDSHGHVHKFPIVLKAIIPIMQKYGIVNIRRPENIFHRKLYIQRLLNPLCFTFFKFVKCSDFFYGSLYKSKDNLVLKNFINDTRLSSKSLELSVHPGEEEDWRRAEKNALIVLVCALKQNSLINFVSYNEV